MKTRTKKLPPVSNFRTWVATFNGKDCRFMRLEVGKVAFVAVGLPRYVFASEVRTPNWLPTMAIESYFKGKSGEAFTGYVTVEHPSFEALALAFAVHFARANGETLMPLPRH